MELFDHVSPRIRAGKAVAERASDDLPDYQVVNVNSTEHEGPRSVGAEHVVLEMIRELGLDEKLSEMGFSRPWRVLLFLW